MIDKNQKGYLNPFEQECQGKPDGKPCGKIFDPEHGIYCGKCSPSEEFPALAVDPSTTGTGSAVVRWADAAQYVSEPATSTAPVVTLLSATGDPLGEISSLCAIYEGRVVRSLRDVTDEERRRALRDMQLTKLSGPLEAVKLHFLIENVTRAWTHQAVRMRFGTFIAQESMRFAVVEDWEQRVPNPPGYETWSASAQRIWNVALVEASEAYTFLVQNGVAAEDARGLMPHAITTRMHLVIDLRSLLTEAGKRLCTQAQFEWRVVMAGIVKAIRQYGAEPYPGRPAMYSVRDDGWQFETIADLLRPVCYAEGRCGFMASMDRGCTIRKRVDVNAKAGRPSREWDTNGHVGDEMCDDPSCPGYLHQISPAEWALDPGAARVKPS